MLSAVSDLQQLAEEFWAWRAQTQPNSGDDIPRLERPPGWLPDWSPDAVAARGERLARFDAEWHRLAAAARDWSVPRQVDHRLIGSAIARVRWELDVLQSWRRNPHFYVHQTLGPILDTLLVASVDTTQVQRLADRIPETLIAARANLGAHAVAPFAGLAIAALDGIRSKLRAVEQALPRSAVSFGTATEALENFATWLQTAQPQMPDRTPIGRDAYAAFLRDVALIPMTPEQVAAAGQQELARSIAFEALERNRELAPLSLPASQQELIANHERAEAHFRDFCEQNDLLSFPDWLQHYTLAPQPPYLVPLRGLGVFDDLTAPSRLTENGVHYIPEPSSSLPYFYLAMAHEPRSMIAHEGVHYYQLARSWAHENPIRRHYYDSGPNEGIGFYAEELMLQAGMFDDQPRSREIIYNFMRLRALRVAVDVQLALGELDVSSAARKLAQLVPMDEETAQEEAAMFASEPGQAISYQIGKLQILKFLSDARLHQADSFNLRTFHDSLFKNGNVPIALQRWETLDLSDELDFIDRTRNPRSLT